MKQPAPFLEIRVHKIAINPSISGLCVGYELGEWRASQFASHMIEWLPEFALTYSELTGVNSGNMVALMREAAKRIYKTEKFQNRGEFGELFLHAAIRQVFKSQPAISKIYYKSAVNDTVKGFDAVHVVSTTDGFELWLGESKFYNEINAAIRDVTAELRLHMERDYLRDEFLLITGKVDDEWPQAADFKKLLSTNTSLDVIFKRVCIPVLLTYDSTCIANNNECSEKYLKEFETEIISNYQKFCGKDLPKRVMIHLFLLPLKSKEILIQELDRRLQGARAI